MRKKFYKMHGVGNDYVYFNCLKKEIPSPEKLAVRLCDRHCFIGGDGIILICKSKIADAKMRIFNADGSEGKMCGNGIRCVAKFLYDNKKVKNSELTVETLSGVKRLWICAQQNEKATQIKVDMGKADFSPENVPVLLPGKSAVNRRITIDKRHYVATCLSVGNPHCVVFSSAPEPFFIEAGKLEKSPLFPEGVNVEFVELLKDGSLRVRVWERGSGETLSCGTGACATVAAAVENGFLPEGKDVTVHLKGGDLTVNYTKERVFMTGPAVLAYTGIIEI